MYYYDILLKRVVVIEDKRSYDMWKHLRELPLLTALVCAVALLVGCLLNMPVLGAIGLLGMFTSVIGGSLFGLFAENKMLEKMTYMTIKDFENKYI